MVLCWIALPILAILGIFSAKYRKLTAESFDCLFRGITFRKCRSNLDERIKSDITGKLMKRSPTAAKWFYRNYKIIGVIILIIMILSLYFTVTGVYNYVKYGNCNGKDSDGFCIIGTVKDFPGLPNQLSEGLLNDSEECNTS